MFHPWDDAMQLVRKAAFLAALWAFGSGAAWADAKAGREKSRACATCHGQLGLSTLPNAPHLAGQPEVYLLEQLKAYRSGKRQHEVMAVIARPLSDADIGDLAAWYASLLIEVREKP
jgi:cytochrome c553